MLAAVSLPEAMGHAERAQAMLERDTRTAVIVGLGALLLGAVVWIVRLHRLLTEAHRSEAAVRDALYEKRLADRDAAHARLDALAREVAGYIQQNTSASLALQRTMDEQRPRRRTTSSPSLPVVAPPVPRVTSPLKEDASG